MSDYFGTMGIPVVAGRGFDRTDVASLERVVIVNEALASKALEGTHPVGQRLRPNLSASMGTSNNPWHTVIGVAKDVKEGGVDRIDVIEKRRVASMASSCFTVVGLQAGALKPQINPGGHLRPQTDLYGEQRVDFEAAQLPTLFPQLRKRSPPRPSELAPQLLIRQETADDSFNRSMCHGNSPFSNDRHCVLPSRTL